MKLQFSWKYLLAFVPLLFIMGETHELAHTSVGRFICGCWGQRDFNVWGLCKGCKDTYPLLSILATFAGPLYSFIWVWIGYFLLGKNRSNTSKIWGISIIGANILFARILTSLLFSGDEVYGMRRLTDSFYLSWILGLTIVLCLSIPPLVRVYRTLANEKKNLWFIGFLMVPFITVLVIGISLNTALKNGIWNEYWILGSPKIITYWLFLMLVLFIINRKKINLLIK